MAVLETLSSVTVAITPFNCLFGPDSVCFYNPKLPTIYFSLGEAVAAIGLIFAVFQLKNPSWDIALRIRNKFQRNIFWYFTALGTISIFIATILPQTGISQYPYSYPIFWELLGFCFFVSAPASLWYMAKHLKGLYTKKNAENFYHVILQNASKNSPERIEASINIIMANLREIICDASVVSRHSSSEPEDYQKIASDLINLLLSEVAIANYIATNRIDFIFNFTELIKEYRPSQYAVGMGFDKLTECLFNNQESYFYKQLSQDGISLYASIYDLIFSDFYILTTFSPLGSWNTYGSPKNIVSDKRYIETFLKALNIAIEVGEFREDYLNGRIGYSLHKIPEYITSVGWLQREELGIKDSTIRDISIAIHGFFGRDFPVAYKKFYENGKMSDCEKAVTKGDRYSQCLTAEFCESLVCLLGEFTRIERKGLDSIYAHMVDEYILPIHQNEALFVNMRNCYLEYAWDQIKENVILGHYPTFIRLHIIEMKWNNPSMPGWRKEERAKLIKYLNEELKPRILKNDKMMNFKDLKEEVLLPENLILDHKRKKFFWVHRDGSKEEFK